MSRETSELVCAVCGASEIDLDDEGYPGDVAACLANEDRCLAVALMVEAGLLERPPQPPAQAP